jgi:hypothetical protein
MDLQFSCQTERNRKNIKNNYDEYGFFNDIKQLGVERNFGKMILRSMPASTLRP